MQDLDTMARLGVPPDTRMVDLTVEQYILLHDILNERRAATIKGSSVEITRGQSGGTGFSVKEYEVNTLTASRLARATYQELERDFPGKGGK